MPRGNELVYGRYIKMIKLYYGKGECYLEDNSVIAGVQIEYFGKITIEDRTSDSFVISASNSTIIIFPIRKYQPLKELFSYVGEFKIKKVILAGLDGKRVSSSIIKDMDYSYLLNVKAEDLTTASKDINSQYVYRAKRSKTSVDKDIIQNLDTSKDKVKLYLKDGTQYNGKFHIHKNGKIMSGSTHTKDSVILKKQGINVS